MNFSKIHEGGGKSVIAAIITCAVLVLSLTGETPAREEWAHVRLEEATIKKLLVDEFSNQYIVLLESKETGRVFPIWIGMAEAMAIEIKRKHITTTRPMTHDLLADIIKKLNGRMKRVIIHSLRNNIYYAFILLEQGGKEITVDSRPSDAIALSLRTGAPIFVAKSIFDSQSIGMLKEKTSVFEPFTGIMVQDITPELARILGLKSENGALISRVEKGGRAARMGLRRRDVIMEVNGKPVKNKDAFLTLIESEKEKGKIHLKLVRGGRFLEKDIY